MRNKSILILISGFIALACFAHELTTKTSGLKNRSLHPQSELLVRTKKLLPPIELEIKNPSESPTEENVPFTLEATISASRNLSNIKYQWKLPPGVSLTAGSGASGTLNSISQEQDVTLTATFISTSNQNEKIHLLMWSDDPANKLQISAQYNTQDQEAINSSKRELVQRQNDYLLNNPDLLKHSK